MDNNKINSNNHPEEVKISLFKRDPSNDDLNPKRQKLSRAVSKTAQTHIGKNSDRDPSDLSQSPKRQKLNLTKLSSSISDPEENKTEDYIQVTVGGEKFVINKNRAAEESKLIKAMLESPYKEKKQNQIDFPEENSKFFTVFVNLIKKEKTEKFEDPNDTILLWFLADKLDSELLKSEALQQMHKTITIKDLIYLIEGDYPMVLIDSFITSFPKVKAGELSKEIQTICRNIEETSDKDSERNQQKINQCKRLLALYINHHKVQLERVLVNKNITQFFEWMKSVEDDLKFMDLSDIIISEQEAQKLNQILSKFRNEIELALELSSEDEQILDLIKRGMSFSDIGRELNRSPRYVRDLWYRKIRKNSPEVSYHPRRKQ